MNTSLLNTNTTNNTTKNLKMMAAVICMTAVFVFTNTVVFAQAISNSEGKTTVTKTETQSSLVISAKGQTVSKPEGLKEQKREENKFTEPAFDKPAVVETQKKTETVKNVTPVTSAKQVVTPQSAETIDNAVNVKAAAVENSNTGEVKQTKTLAEQRTTRSSSVAVRNEVKPYDVSTVVNDVTPVNVNYPAIPGFVATGNAAVDAKAFSVAKANLEQSNPAEYNKYFSVKK